MSRARRSDKRHFHRVAHDAPATLSRDDKILPCKILDLSLKGCLIELSNDWDFEPGQIYELRIDLSPTVRIVMDVSLAHRDGTKAGFVCQRADLDSISALKRLVELNLGDEELLERDLRALASSSDH
ncbi:PilZ domain-containing protein [Methylocaldum szegediense]|uniref:Cyclic diguanosine monophosphate-binding protein n=1 Tax=Methylocaldum szegediense TaxID=73780 RepID=A0ABM9HXL6_9GAMM|nr:PilZ domain-containing protein [Methylocaldum szegediense]CAI8754215.1 Cyclic diguanosine monophosphate-binding protein PA4608 [Methylocaldum szegediense]